MAIFVDITDTKVIRGYPQPKKSRRDSTLYDIFLLFTFSECGFVHFRTVISTGIEIPMKLWGEKQAIGKSGDSAIVNKKLLKLYRIAQLALENYRIGKDPSSEELKNFIRSTVKTQLTGNAPRGDKEAVEQRVKKQLTELTLAAVLEKLIKYRNISAGRARIYKHALNVLQRFFIETKGSVPLITDISEIDLMDFEVWFRDHYHCSRGKRKGLPVAQNSATTWFTMISALFKFAHKPLKIIKELPLPERFRGAFVEAKRKVLDKEDFAKIMQMGDHKLSRPKQVAKYSMLLGLTTGIAMVDIKALSKEHVSRNREADRLRIEKIREKHLKNPNITEKKPFRVVMSATAEYAYYKLRELAPGDGDFCFKLTSDTNLSKHYKNLMAMAGVSVHTTHYVLRHSFAVDFMTNNGRLEDLGEILGNDIRTTQIYGKISDERLAENTRQLEQKSKFHQLSVSKTSGVSQLVAV